ncbi:MAG: HAD family phosphatase [Prevotellaceae bacterium]|jgi:HAD superfamily hydrolase (TIGR01509 family)|nr:HAD family phosphatase [Prevotellaceae bacterium]
MIFLFDLDGVILDSEPQYDKFWNKQGELYNRGNNFASKIKGQTMPQILTKYFYDFSDDEKNKLVSDCMQFEAAMECPLIAGAENFIVQLKSQNIKTGLVTSSDDIKLSRIIEKFKMQTWFDTIVTANRVTHSKPNPQGYLLAARDLKTDAKNCIVFEDSFAGIEAGRNAGMKVIALATTNPRKALQATTNADLIIDDFVGFSYEDCLKVI